MLSMYANILNYIQLSIDLQCLKETLHRMNVHALHHAWLLNPSFFGVTPRLMYPSLYIPHFRSQQTIPISYHENYSNL